MKLVATLFKRAIGLLIIAAASYGAYFIYQRFMAADEISVALLTRGVKANATVTRAFTRTTQKSSQNVVELEYVVGKPYKLEILVGADTLARLRGSKELIEVTYLPDAPHLSRLSSEVGPITTQRRVTEVVMVGLVFAVGLLLASIFFN